jgi:hypothetical protein
MLTEADPISHPGVVVLTALPGEVALMALLGVVALTVPLAAAELTSRRRVRAMATRVVAISPRARMGGGDSHLSRSHVWLKN